MKKKHRDITVNGETYAWSIGKVNGDGDGGFGLRIWKNRRPVYEDFLPAGRVKTITPSMIREIIERRKI